MKRILPLLTAIALPLLGADLPDLTTYTKLNEDEHKIVLLENFDNGTDGWELTPTCRWEPKEGMTGTGALLASRDDPKQRILARRKIRLRPEIMYRIRLNYRLQQTESPRLTLHEPFCIRFINSKNHKVDRGAFFAWRDSGDKADWQSVERNFTLPVGYEEEAYVELIMRTGRTGTFWYDNLTIEATTLTDFALFPLENSIMTYDAARGLAFFVKAPASRPPQDLAVLVETAGSRALFPVTDGRARGQLGTLPQGNHPLKASLLDTKKKEILYTHESHLFVRDVPNIPGRIVMEPDGRMLRDGKPFLPVGVYLGFHEQNDPGQLQKIKDAGFNCLEGLWNNIQVLVPPQETETARMQAACREIARHGLGVLIAIKYQLPHHPARHEKLDGITGLDNVTRHIVNTYKQEPNVLGWYVSDENPITEIPAICRLRETISELDPWHPTMTLTDRPGNFLFFARSGDYIMHDSYPVGLGNYRDTPAQTMLESHRALDAILKVGTPFVWVPQIFPWGSSWKKLPNRYPTELEMRSMALLGAIYGAHAYFFYSYHHCFYYAEKMTPGNADSHWQNVKAAVAVINELTPYFLSREPAPAAAVRQLAGPAVLARAFTANGKTAVVITADGPGEASADITVTNTPGLKSRYGRTRETAPGVYRFTGLHIDSDVLLQE